MSSNIFEWCNCCWPSRKEKPTTSAVDRATVYFKEPVVVTPHYPREELDVEKVPEIVITSPRSNYDPDEFYTARTSRSVERYRFKNMQSLIKEIRVEILTELDETAEKNKP
ncbi:unnamed protein product [Bursaphelenchus xylophilus]|uniref:(pine wood nematode) hypothetical protein n=1 Tax=Bursaphelenchus xylophilus TaxID=6326 RepID=A0A1I7S8Y0_BURXY|nr:unnamed protein product [Bursaphelenchus xylophilus]CAG9085995.1 unnamed protein product [Bursaphelenchus xylophilus]